MIEQTALVVTEWDYQPPADIVGEEQIKSSVSLDVMQKRAANKKGIACRFSCRYTYLDRLILDYVGEDSYVIDLEDRIDTNELLNMIRNSYSKFTDTFELRKLNTVLYKRVLKPLDESKINTGAILPLLA